MPRWVARKMLFGMAERRVDRPRRGAMLQKYAAPPRDLTSSSPQDESVRLADKGLLDPPGKNHAFSFAGTSLLTKALVVFSKRIPQALSTIRVAAAMSRNIQIGCSRMRSPSQIT